MTGVFLANKAYLLHATYLLASLAFVLGLRDMNSARTARRGMFLAEGGMLLAIIGTLLHQEIVTFEWIAAGLVVGSLVGIPMGLWIPMTAVPQRTALSHAFGALAVALVGVAHFYGAYGLGEVLGPWWHGLTGADLTVLPVEGLTLFERAALGFEVILGSLTFTGSLVAAGKLQGTLPGRPITYRGQNIINMLVIVLMVGLWGYVVAHPEQSHLFYALVGVSLVFGLSLVLPIGSADMPVVIAILNSYGGLAASATGFALSNNVLIIAGALDGGSGLILSLLMCKAMNRSWGNVLFGAFGKAPEAGQAADTEGLVVKPTDLEEAHMILDMAESVIIVPGFGMAAAQAQHALRDFAIQLEKKGVKVRYAIHPVAGRMPGHMNVLLAEANVPYDQLFDLDHINDDFKTTSVALVVGANDVVNPAAKEDPSSPIFGMPILNVDEARTVIILKRGMSPGFSGVENLLFYKDNARMLFGDAKASLATLAAKMKE